PNPNDHRFERDSFKLLLQLIYSVSSKRDKTKDDEAGSKPAVDFEDMLATLQVGFVAMNADGKILYANKAAPLRVDSDGNSSLELLFDQNDDLDSWVKECSEHSVRGEKIWQ